MAVSIKSIIGSMCNTDTSIKDYLSTLSGIIYNSTYFSLVE